MEKKLTITDIANIAQVAKSTVSRYLNGGPVSTKTREKIDKVVIENNYQPNTFAQSLKQKVNHTVGVIVPRLDSTAQVEMLRGLDAANKNDTFLIVNTYQSIERELAAIEKLRTQNVGGLIVLTANLNDELRAALADFDAPVVIQGQEEPSFHRVVMNDLASGTIVGEFAASLSPKNVLLLKIDETKDWAIGHDRFLNIQKRLSSTHITVVNSNFSIAEAKVVAQKAMQSQTFDLIIGATDRITIGALQAGLAMHQNAQYIGFGKSDLSTTVTPNLTSFEYDFYQTGKQIYKLFRMVRDNKPLNKIRIVIDGQLTIRDSTKK
ncbi:LacI family DNA-binding transcriptional regulator [Leuconostoc litchii]|uniref:LacI family DNA-binding transcriptional regulator n=1 Tax=Leuconostoc litchii TaxID=1981069 RepID=A0A6P2CNH5_9LACO|nr:LacI family DNA-binding transcriptional regulator [Leuconostoc litchii]TYC47615.1 LacI family DNA-binding transcriptional regulator [Leuconostoc litchii]